VKKGSSTAVLHLVWGPLGSEPLREFLRSYHSHEAGVSHELVVVFNGVGHAGRDMQTRGALLAELQGTPHRLLELERPVLDLVAYSQAAAMLDHERLCLLNSHSRLCADGWLAALDRALQGRGVGIVGASGSWASMHSYALHHLGLPSPYRRVWPDRVATARAFEGLEVERTGTRPAGGLLGRVHTARALAGMTIGFSSFPAPHLRTNALMVDRLLLRRVLSAGARRKVDTHRLESGRQGITRQVQRAGLRTLVVDRSGRSFEPPDWPASETFWQGDQRGLLVSDNQTDTYGRGDDARRRLLSHYAWGDRAAPAPALARPLQSRL
jgi:hypothetical protein